MPLNSKGYGPDRYEPNDDSEGSRLRGSNGFKRLEDISSEDVVPEVGRNYEPYDYEEGEDEEMTPEMRIAAFKAVLEEAEERHRRQLEDFTPSSEAQEAQARIRAGLQKNGELIDTDLLEAGFDEEATKKLKEILRSKAGWLPNHESHGKRGRQ